MRKTREKGGSGAARSHPETADTDGTGMFRHGTLVIVSLAILASACASTGAVPQPFPSPTRPTGVRPRSNPPVERDPTGVRPHSTGIDATTPFDGYSVAGTALSLRGTPYRNGGADPSSGFDCSGFVWYVFSQHGVSVPRTVSQQYISGVGVGSGELQAGDLVFFTTDAPGASHVGMMIGGDEFVHAPSSRGDVRVERISARYWAERYVGAKRMR
jgi:cell wall-associated NlpC family hydrolase